MHVYNIYKSAQSNTLNYRAIVHIEGSPSHFTVTTYCAWRELDLEVELGYRRLQLTVQQLRSPGYESNVRDTAILDPTAVGTCNKVALSWRPLTLAFPANYSDSQFSIVPSKGNSLAHVQKHHMSTIQLTHIDLTMLLYSLTGWNMIYSANVFNVRFKEVGITFLSKRDNCSGMIMIWTNSSPAGPLAQVTIRLNKPIEEYKWLTGSCKCFLSEPGASKCSFSGLL